MSAPWGGMPIGLPINARLHRKHDPITTVAHATAMLRQLADWLPDKTLDVRGTTHTRLVYSRDVLWFGVCRTALVRLVIVRDPRGIEPDDFFFSTDLTATPAAIASRYAGRWSIEVTFRDTKQDLGGENPQSWKRQGPERAACLALWLHGLTCVRWYLEQHPRGGTWIVRPWYPRKTTPSFLDALAALRRSLWQQRITELSADTTGPNDKTVITEACSTRSPTRPDTAKVHEE